MCWMDLIWTTGWLKRHCVNHQSIAQLSSGGAQPESHRTTAPCLSWFPLSPPHHRNKLDWVRLSSETSLHSGYMFPLVLSQMGSNVLQRTLQQLLSVARQPPLVILKDIPVHTGITEKRQCHTVMAMWQHWFFGVNESLHSTLETPSPADICQRLYRLC